MNKKNILFHRFRMMGIAEGISFLVLVLIAMPLKYIAHLPEPVKYFGWMHGALFIVYLLTALTITLRSGKRFSWLVKAFFAALIPLGTFIFDRQLKREEAAASAVNP